MRKVPFERSATHSIHAMIGAAERMRGAVRRRVGEHRDAGSRFGRAPARAARASKAEWPRTSYRALSSAGSRRRARPCARDSIPSRRPCRRDSRSVGTPALSSACCVSSVPDCDRRLSGGTSTTAASMPQRFASLTIQLFIHGGRCSTSFIEQMRLASACIGRSCSSRMYCGPAKGMYIDQTKTAP